MKVAKIANDHWFVPFCYIDNRYDCGKDLSYFNFQKDNQKRKRTPSLEYFIYFERFSKAWGKTMTRGITLTNHKRSKQRDEPIRIPINYLYFAQSAGKIAHTRGYWFCFSLAKKLGRGF